MQTQEKTRINVQAIVLGLIFFAAEQGVKSFPPNGDRLWHILLYEIQEKLGKEFPGVSLGRFNWDLEYPTHPDLDTIYMATLLFCPMAWSGRLLAPDCYYTSTGVAVSFRANPKFAKAVFELAKELPEFFEF